MSQLTATIISTTIENSKHTQIQPHVHGARVFLADGREAMIAVHALRGESHDERMSRLSALRRGDEICVELSFSIEVERKPVLGVAETGSPYLFQKKTAEFWLSQKRILSGPVIRAHRAYYFSVDLPEGLSGRLQFCDLRGATQELRRDRMYAIKLTEKVRVQVRSVYAWPTGVEIYLKEIDV